MNAKPMAFSMLINRLFSGPAVVMSLVALLAAPLLQAEISGTVGGLVRDERGVPRMGAVITLLTPEGRPIKRVFSDYRGIFTVEHLFPGDYSIRVTLDRFLPLLKQHIRIESGRKTILDVNLRGVFASLQMLFPDGGEIRDMSDDWKWVLKTASTTRPVLRFLPEERREMHTVMRKVSGSFSDTRGYAEVSACGGARPSGLANETDLGTAFAVATSLLGNNDLIVSGNLGYGSRHGLAFGGVSHQLQPGSGGRSTGSFSYGAAASGAGARGSIHLRLVIRPKPRLAANIYSWFRGQGEVW